MALKFKQGDAVVQVLPASFAGKVVTEAIVEESGGYLVRSTDAAGTIHEHWFKEEELEVAK